MALEMLADFISVHAGHHHIQQDEVRVWLGLCQRQGAFPIQGDLDLVLSLQNGRRTCRFSGESSTTRIVACASISLSPSFAWGAICC
jgi:hypothetical protein